MAELHIQFGQQDADDRRASSPIANDNVEREQELFERAASREGAGEED